MKAIIVVPILCAAAFAQRPGINYDESKVPQYTLPDLLTLENGQKVRDARTWKEKRRPEILKLLETQMFGRSAPRPEKISFEMTSIDRQALAGKAVRKEISINTAGKAIHLLLYLPAGAKGRVPVFVGLNFTGNHAIHKDPGITLPATVWVRDPETKAYTARAAAPESRGSASNRWPVEMILARGYGLGTVYYGDIEPDFAGGMPHGIRPFFFKPGQKEPTPDEWGAIGAWAWGLSRVVDYLETDKDVDAKRIAVMGHSRLGKTAR